MQASGYLGVRWKSGDIAVIVNGLRKQYVKHNLPDVPSEPAAAPSVAPMAEPMAEPVAPMAEPVAEPMAPMVEPVAAAGPAAAPPQRTWVAPQRTQAEPEIVWRAEPTMKSYFKKA